MALNIFYLILAALGLGVLIFIHELGHYWMARREGMTVEVFSIGFGKPFYRWERNGVRWQLCYLPFGGYVRIAGMEKKGRLEPYQIAGGFYAKKPWSRIKVALMGPIVNIAFAFVAFSLIWVTGGRLKNFSAYTHLIGQVNPRSTLYTEGVRPGDEIEQLNGKSFHSFNDIFYSAMLDDAPIQLRGWKINYWTQDKNAFTYQFPFHPTASGMTRAGSAMGSLAPAQYVIYQGASWLTDAPMKNSGIQTGDRIVWVDGTLIFSQGQLVSVINESLALLTIQRDRETFVVRVPRVPLPDLRLTAAQRAELDDWQHAAQITVPRAEVYFIPYNLTESNQVEEPIVYVDEQSYEQLPPTTDRLLQPGDQILAVDGQPVTSAQGLFRQLQTRQIQMIVHRGSDTQSIAWDQADAAFIGDIDWRLLHQMVNAIGTDKEIPTAEGLHRLQPVIPKPRIELDMPTAVKDRYEKAHTVAKKKAESSPDKDRTIKELDRHHRRLALGILLDDRKVWYNPNPFVLFGDVVRDVYRTLGALFTGYVSPKQMAGPVGIIQVMQNSWGESFKEALFWMGMISLNLGIFNLLPIPVLDGGHICFSLWEAVTKKPIQSKTMERWVIPFVVILIGFFIYVTYHDLVRLLRFFQP